MLLIKCWGNTCTDIPSSVTISSQSWPILSIITRTSFSNAYALTLYLKTFEYGEMEIGGLRQCFMYFTFSMAMGCGIFALHNSAAS